MVTFRPRSAVATQECRLQTTVLGTPLALPLLLAPVGSSRLFYPRGEAVAAEGAGNAGTAYILSTLSGCRLEEVKTASKGPVWYQLYLVGGRDVAKGAIERARAAGFSALVITIDTPVAGLRERDLRNGMTRLVSRRFWSMLPVVSQFLARPRWLAGFLSDGGLMAFPNVVLPGVGPMSYADVGAALEQSMVAWDDLRWIREIWKGPIVVKGVLTGEDARRAVAEGAAAVVVSNHGGRQLDGAMTSLRALPAIVQALGEDYPVMIDSGFRRGGDVLIALALGAKFVFVGRPFNYAGAIGGQAGIVHAAGILASEISRNMALLGVLSPAEVGPTQIRARQA